MDSLAPSRYRRPHFGQIQRMACADQPSTPDLPTVPSGVPVGKVDAGVHTKPLDANKRLRRHRLPGVPVLRLASSRRCCWLTADVRCQHQTRGNYSTAGAPHGPRVFSPTDMARAIIWDTGGGGAPSYRRPVASRWSWLSARCRRRWTASGGPASAEVSAMATIAWLHTGHRFLRAAHIDIHLCGAYQREEKKRGEGDHDK